MQRCTTACPPPPQLPRLAISTGPCSRSLGVDQSKASATGTFSARCAFVAPSLSYVLPIRAEVPAPDELFNYLRSLSDSVEVIVVDGSPGPVFHDHARRLKSNATHIRPDAVFADMLNQKVAGVLSGARRASHPAVIIADDDVRYDEAALAAMAAALEHADVVRPQNY